MFIHSLRNSKTENFQIVRERDLGRSRERGERNTAARTGRKKTTAYVDESLNKTRRFLSSKPLPNHNMPRTPSTFAFPPMPMNFWYLRTDPFDWRRMIFLVGHPAESGSWLVNLVWLLLTGSSELGHTRFLLSCTEFQDNLAESYFS